MQSGVLLCPGRLLGGPGWSWETLRNPILVAVKNPSLSYLMSLLKNAIWSAFVTSGSFGCLPLSLALSEPVVQ